MGRSLALNFLDRGINVVGWNLEQEVAHALVVERDDDGLRVVESLTSLVAALRGRDEAVTILMMIKAGPAVDETLGVLLPLLATGDILIDGGNTHFRETQERRERLSLIHI